MAMQTVPVEVQVNLTGALEGTVVRRGDSVIIRHTSWPQPLDPYSEKPREEQLDDFACGLRQIFGEGIGVVVLGGAFEVTVLRGPGSAEASR